MYVFSDLEAFCPSINPVPILLSGSVDSATISGDMLSFQCSFEANYIDFKHNVSTYWTIIGPNKQLIRINETNTLGNHSVRVYEDCLLTNRSCCIVTSELTITNVPISLDGVTVMCFAGLSLPNSLKAISNATLSKSHVYTVL